jgi:energy-coupling factor transport system ATP-binding protein
VVEQEVAFGPENLGLPTAEIRERVEDALRAVGLQDHRTAESHALSMADKQRVAIAAVIALYPRYLILDEPTAWVEPAGRWKLLDEVLRWSSTREAGLILVTHRMDEAQVCSRLYGMLRGRVEIVGTPQQVLCNDEARARLALEMPDVLVLTDELRAAGLPVEPSAGVDHLAEALSRS